MVTKVYAIISLPNGKVVEGECEHVESHNTQLIHVTIAGKKYCVHWSNIVLIYEEE